MKDYNRELELDEERDDLELEERLLRDGAEYDLDEDLGERLTLELEELLLRDGAE